MGSKEHLSFSLFSHWAFFSRLQLIIDALGCVQSLEGHAISAELKKTHRWRQKEIGTSNRVQG